MESQPGVTELVFFSLCERNFRNISPHMKFLTSLFKSNKWQASQEVEKQNHTEIQCSTNQEWQKMNQTLLMRADILIKHRNNPTTQSLLNFCHFVLFCNPKLGVSQPGVAKKRTDHNLKHVCVVNDTHGHTHWPVCRTGRRAGWRQSTLLLYCREEWWESQHSDNNCR